MSRGISIHIGLNHVDPSRYDGWDGELAGCINDANDMKAIADDLGYTATLMIDSQATCLNVVSAIGQAAQQLNSGDILLLTYSGHGAQVPDVGGDESDANDETWLLWDRMLVDDELYNLWAQFRAGVRIFMLSDSCHSGTVLRMQAYEQIIATEEIARHYHRAKNVRPTFRNAPASVVSAVYQRDRALYDTAQWTSGGSRAAIGASVILISGCQDNQLSADGARNGLFTENVLEVWNGGAFVGDYVEFHRRIANQMPPTQSPNFARAGSPNTAFDAEKPFTVSAATQPTISAPASVQNGGTPVRFSVNPGHGRKYAVEVATNPKYLTSDFASQRTDDNFFGSWRTLPLGSSASYPASYEMPQAAWDRLRRAGGRLYYRIWATDSPTSWVNSRVSTPDASAQNAPSFELAQADTGVVPTAGLPSIDGPSTIPGSSAPPRFLLNPGPNRYAVVEVTTNPYYFIHAQYAAQRNDNNFFGSWRQTPFNSAVTFPMGYDLPQAAWDRLRASGPRLYYRIWATDSPNSWVNALSNTPDGQALSAKSMAIT